jgi:hypothetical protein
MLQKGPFNIRKNIIELNTGKIGPARKKAIATYAKKHNITKEEARFRQSLIIAREIAKK